MLGTTFSDVFGGLFKQAAKSCITALFERAVHKQLEVCRHSLHVSVRQFVRLPQHRKDHHQVVANALPGREARALRLEQLQTATNHCNHVGVCDGRWLAPPACRSVCGVGP
eukprot:2337161-Rhodomonas_salina.2